MVFRDSHIRLIFLRNNSVQVYDEDEETINDSSRLMGKYSRGVI